MIFSYNLEEQEDFEFSQLHVNIPLTMKPHQAIELWNYLSVDGQGSSELLRDIELTPVNSEFLWVEALLSIETMYDEKSIYIVVTIKEEYSHLFSCVEDFEVVRANLLFKCLKIK